MIDLYHKYALLENGEIESLWYDFNNGYREQREVEMEKGEFYLNYDKWESWTSADGGSWTSVARIHAKIIKTANNKQELEEYKRELKQWLESLGEENEDDEV